MYDTTAIGIDETINPNQDRLVLHAETCGVVAFIGEITLFQSIMVGIKYFQCRNKHGTFVKPCHYVRTDISIRQNRIVCSLHCFITKRIDSCLHACLKYVENSWNCIELRNFDKIWKLKPIRQNRIGSLNNLVNHVMLLKYLTNACVNIHTFIVWKRIATRVQ